MDSSPDMLTDRFKQAFNYAFELHLHQKRKGSQIPYISHLLGVTSLVLEDGGDEDEAIAALLHDAVEDQGGAPILAEIRSRFGERVAQIVDDLTDAYGAPKPPWRERKEGYLAHLRNVDPAVRRVSLADKLHNARSILANLQTIGDATWKRFNGGRVPYGITVTWSRFSRRVNPPSWRPSLLEWSPRSSAWRMAVIDFFSSRMYDNDN